MIDTSTETEERRRDRERAILATHGKYAGGKRPVFVQTIPTNVMADPSMGSRSDRLDRLVVTYVDGLAATFWVFAPHVQRELAATPA